MYEFKIQGANLGISFIVWDDEYVDARSIVV